MTKQTTFLMLKPDAFRSNHQEDILKRLKGAHLVIESSKTVNVDLDVMKTLIEHYGEVIDKMDPAFNFPGKLFNSFYYYGPHTIMPMCVSYSGDEDIIEYTRKLVGATSPANAAEGTIRGDLSDDDYDKAGAQNRLVNNLIHASDSFESKERELTLWREYL
ncbi:nucleoside diphosphate kinase [Erysipelothrix larvae]|uniref:nucleoside-diphosphate kinase n=1 Tax=Erysipelothrix larvae TaxID=1514105 RepID=A0A0X8H1V7_9FIRM|nr:nucleoside-diphosphate kinase [Erysipelothrix larvae]AMC94538.1 nucleoside diphosphate kinase [Erysipelothrix larvae]